MAGDVHHTQIRVTGPALGKGKWIFRQEGKKSVKSMVSEKGGTQHGVKKRPLTETLGGGGGGTPLCSSWVERTRTEGEGGSQTQGRAK